MATADPIREALALELARRREGNPRYSLRSFAASLSVDHSGLSRVLRGERAPSDSTRERLRRALRPDRDARRLLALASGDGCPADSRACAILLGIGIDRVNVALAALLAEGLLRMEGDRWVHR